MSGILGTGILLSVCQTLPITNAIANYQQSSDNDRRAVIKKS